MSNQSLSQKLTDIIARNKRGELGTVESMNAINEAISAEGVGCFQEQQRLRQDANLLLSGLELARQGDTASDPTQEQIDHLRRSAEELESRQRVSSEPNSDT
jgi:polyhydroxyalkanoate synthesis regulator phasin